MLLFVFACTPKTEPTQNVPETPEDFIDTVGPEMPADVYSDLQTQEDTFDAMDDALDTLE